MNENNPSNLAKGDPSSKSLDKTQLGEVDSSIPGHRKRTDLGKDSISLGLACLLLVIVICAVGLMTGLAPGERYPMLSVVQGVFILVALIGATVGLVLGFMRVCRKCKGRWYGILGLAINSLTIALVVLFHRIAPWALRMFEKE